MNRNTKQNLLDLLKRTGELSLDDAIDRTGLARTTLKEHFMQLERDQFVQHTYRRHGRGRPKLVYTLTEEGEQHFPSQESKMLGELLRYLKEESDDEFIEHFFEKFWDQRLKEAKHRMSQFPEDDLERRLEALQNMLQEEGFMPEVETYDHSLRIRECNCPFSEAVKETRLPCKLEAKFFEELFNAEMKRVSYIPDGNPSCSYEMNLNEE